MNSGKSATEEKVAVIRAILMGDNAVWGRIGLSRRADTVQNEFIERLCQAYDWPGLALVIGLDYLDAQNLPGAKEWLEYSSELGGGGGYFNIATEIYASKLSRVRAAVHFNGRDPSPILEKVYLHKAAAKGNAVALLLLGQIALQVDKNARHAVRYWRMGARAGNAECALSMAYYFAVDRHRLHASLRWFLDAWQMSEGQGIECWIYESAEFWPAVAHEQQRDQLQLIHGKLRQRDFKLKDHPRLLLHLVRWVKPYVENYRQIFQPDAT